MPAPPPALPRRVAWFAPLATVCFLAYVLRQAERRSGDQPQPRAQMHTVEQLERIAAESLRIGMTFSEVNAVLRLANLTGIRGSHGITSHHYYGSGRLSDPVLIVSFRVGPIGMDDELRATEWEVEK